MPAVSAMSNFDFRHRKIQTQGQFNSPPCLAGRRSNETEETVHNNFKESLTLKNRTARGLQFLGRKEGEIEK